MKITYALAALVLICAACSKKAERETPNGFKYTMVSEGNDSLAKPGQLLLVDFILKDSKDSVWSETYKGGMPAPVMIGDSASAATEPGIVQMFRELSPGDSVVCTMTVKQFFKELGDGYFPPNIDTTRSVSYFFKVKSITTREEFETKQRKIAEEKRAKQHTIDVAAIDKYLADKGITAEKLESGIRYIITKPGKGNNGVAGNTASVNYVGYNLRDEFFDTNVKKIAEEKGLYDARREPYAPFDVTIDQSQVIEGWHAALKVLNKGAKATVYIPSTMAYGPGSRGEKIRENEILIFDLELVNLK